MTPEPEAGKWRRHGAVAAGYLLLAIIVIDHGASLTKTVLGSGDDPLQQIWFLAWWPWALSHHVDPLFTNLIWQPGGVNLAWTTCTPLLALFGLPFTLLSGPVLAFNVLAVAAPALAAWAGYFLCLRVSRTAAAAIIGGYLFGFSAYEMAQTPDHPNLDFIIFVPLIMLVVLRRLDGCLSRASTVALAALLLGCQFLASVEIFATICMFGGIAWLIWFALVPSRRQALLRLLMDGAVLALVLITLLSPYLFAMFGRPRGILLPAHWPMMFSTDLANLLIPTTFSAVGGGLAVILSGHFTGYLDEQDGYLGLPLLLIILAYAWSHRQDAAAWAILLVLFAVISASLGPQLWAAGVATHIPMPWALARYLPLISSALPARFMLYAALLAAIIAARWIDDAAAASNRRIRLIAGGIACLALAPAAHRNMPAPVSAFFQPGRLETVLGPHATVLIMPFGITGPSSFWQAENRFGFAQTGGYVGFPPASMQTNTAMMRFYFGLYSANLGAAFAAYCAASGTQFVVVGPGVQPEFLAMIDALSWPHRQVDDIVLYTVPKTGSIHG